MRERSKSRDHRRNDSNESFSSMRERSKSRDHRRNDSNESFSNMRERSKSRDRRRIEEGMRGGGYRDRSKSRDRRRIDGNENFNSANERRHEKESSTSSETRGKGSSRNSINLDNYKRKDSLENQNMRKEKSMNNIKLREETRDHSLMKSCSSDDVKNRSKPSKVNVDIYPKRLDSHEKPPITQIKGDRSMTSETSGSNRNSPFISNCRTHTTRTPSMENIPSAVSVDSGTKQTPHIIPGRQRNVSNPTQHTTMDVKTPRVVNYDPISRTPRLPPQDSNSETTIKTPYSSYLENAKTPYLSEPFDESQDHRNSQYEETSSNSQRYKEKLRPYGQNEEFAHIRQRSDSNQDYSSLKSIKSSSAIRNMANHYNNGQEGVKNQIDNRYENSKSISKINHKRNYSEGSSLKHRSEISPLNSSSYDRYSVMSIDNVKTMERLRTSVQFIKNFDKSFKPEGMDRRSYLYEDYFNRNSNGELIDLQMVLVPLNNMFEICTVDLNEPVRFGRSNVDNVENFISFRSLVISRTHAEIWSDNDKVSFIISI